MNNNDTVSPLGFELARELTLDEMNSVGGGVAASKGTAGGSISVSTGRPDGEVHIDADW
ncbi:hypothetical protein SAMN05428989_4110 [Pseudoxanthomonas sp. GM95]|uniref:hypothetical protein n=1 Tax=Pseudoxanthomonas sp. GM95 TaxID=1881043 RepID=UPI0008BFBF54|nr:hypothetical protein [Pseudoxanthomonas sp. GM95]SEM58250.1 hypothetical protein SAMN05428989_4110 [Pseudoxanthomonas sp. GM95]